MDLELQFAEYLQTYALGKANSIKAQNLSSFGNKRDIRHLVNSLRLQGIPICSGQSGYYYAETLDELESTKSFLYNLYNNIRAVHQALEYSEHIDELK